MTTGNFLANLNGEDRNLILAIRDNASLTALSVVDKLVQKEKDKRISDVNSILNQVICSLGGLALGWASGAMATSYFGMVGNAKQAADVTMGGAAFFRAATAGGRLAMILGGVGGAWLGSRVPKWIAKFNTEELAELKSIIEESIRTRTDAGECADRTVGEALARDGSLSPRADGVLTHFLGKFQERKLLLTDVRSFIQKFDQGDVSAENRQTLASMVRRIEDSVRCPLSLGIPEDPVVAGDDHIYSRHELNAWYNHRMREYLDGRSETRPFCPSAGVGQVRLADPTIFAENIELTELCQLCRQVNDIQENFARRLNLAA